MLNWLTTVKSRTFKKKIKKLIFFYLYHRICRNVFLMKHWKQRKQILALWNTERISLLVKLLKSSLINPNISKFREFGESTELVLDTRSNVTSKYGTNYSISTTVLQMRRLWNLCWWIGWYPPPRLNPAETRSNNCGRYTRVGTIDTLVSYTLFQGLIYLGTIVTGLCSCWSVYWDETCLN